jgi:hypothetical protein
MSPPRCEEYTFVPYSVFFQKHAKKGFAVFFAVKIAGMPDEKTSCLPEPLNASVCSLVKAGTLGVKVLSGEEAGIHVLGRWVKDRAQW